MRILLLICLLLAWNIKSYSQLKYNFDFEIVIDSQLYEWGIGQIVDYGIPQNAGKTQWLIDDIIKVNGKRSLRLTNDNDKNYLACGIALKPIRYGHKIKVTGFIKTENIISGYAGLWIRVDNKDTILVFNNMNEDGLIGTNKWKEYSIELNYDPIKATNILIGGIVNGIGTAWFDNFNVFIDETPIQNIPLKDYETYRQVYWDTTSGIKQINISEWEINKLSLFGEIWGFLKYYHPAVAAGKYNMDDELFINLKHVLNAKDKNQFNEIIMNFIKRLGTIQQYKHCVELKKDVRIAILPNENHLLHSKYLTDSVKKCLSDILYKRDTVFENYYVKLDNKIHNPVFLNENSFATVEYPDAGIRLLTLYRYWAMVKYFYPYKHLISSNWDYILTKYIPLFTKTNNKNAYLLTCLKLIAEIGDAHANVISNDIELLKGLYCLPIKTTMIGRNLIVSNDYISKLSGFKIRKGDMILEIDNESILDLYEKYHVITPASNINGSFRKIFSINGFAFRRSENSAFNLKLKRDTQIFDVVVPSIHLKELYSEYIFADTLKYKLIADSIGYINIKNIEDGDFYMIRNKLNNTKGIIFDFRGYPSAEIPYTYGSWLKKNITPFAIFTVGDLTFPGTFIFNDTVSNGNNDSLNTYNGKVILLVNEYTQSASEYAVMGLQSSNNVTTMGSITAGADGNISEIILPGNIKTYFSGIGVYYPDKTETQKKGIKINYEFVPTLQGIQNGSDELLEFAVKSIK